jgi:serine/threonine protein kinase
MHYSPNGTLDDILKRNKFLDEKTAFKYFIQLVSAVNFMHENNYIHRDINPDNCLIDENNVIRLCDFGWCCELSLGNRITFCGTYEYMAPEVMNEMPYNHLVDIWSLGVLLYEMLQGVSPYKVHNLLKGGE